MTRFFVDNREIEQPLDASSLSDVIKQVEAVHLAPNSVIRQIQVDGLPLEMPIPEGNSDVLFQVGRRARIDMFTGTVSEIARDSISDSLQYLDRMETAIPSLITDFQTSPGSETFVALKQLGEGLYWLNILMGKLKSSFQLNLDQIPIKGVPAQEHERKFIAVLKQLIESQQKRDFAMISDLLEYEILPMVPIWKDMLGIIRDKVEAVH